MSRELRGIEVHRPEIARGVTLCLVIEMGRRRMAALAARGHRDRANAVSEFDDRDEAVSARAVPLLRPWIGTRPERRERPPPRRREADGNTRLRIIERLNDVTR